jgi:hypothetical protein
MGKPKSGLDRLAEPGRSLRVGPSGVSGTWDGCARSAGPQRVLICRETVDCSGVIVLFVENLSTVHPTPAVADRSCFPALSIGVLKSHAATVHPASTADEVPWHLTANVIQ